MKTPEQLAKILGAMMPVIEGRYMKFAYDSFPVNELQVKDIKDIREAFSVLTEMIEQKVPKGRYHALVQTKLEEACMFAVKGITHQAGDYDMQQKQA